MPPEEMVVQERIPQKMIRKLMLVIKKNKLRQVAKVKKYLMIRCY